MATVEIEIKPPGGAWTDYTTSCIFSRCSFESQMNGVPGTFDLWLRDPDGVLSFTTGSEVRLTVDGVVLFGGYVLTKGMGSLAPAADTSDLPNYQLRTWHLAGSDYNIVLDKRVFRKTTNYLRHIRINEDVDGQILSTAIGSYTDMSDFSTVGIDNVATIPDIEGYVLLEQGKTVRSEFELLLKFSAATYYVGGDKVVYYMAFEDVEKRWGFSDNPNGNAITVSPASYQGATYGFREVEATEDASAMANDVFVWGGSEWADSGATVFAREEASTSITDHGRWQHAEVHFGERGYRTQVGVDSAAEAIVHGPPGTVGTGQEKGLKYSQWQFSFTWFSNDVPLLSGVPDHIRPGDLVTINLSAFSVTKLRPLRTLRISFPDAFDGSVDEANRVVQFNGTFGLQLSDSFTLWRYIIQNQSRVQEITQQVVTDSSDGTTSGASYSGVPTPTPNDSATVFTIPFAYAAGTTQVFRNGLIQVRGTAYTESDPATGDITFASPPATGDTLWVIATTL